MIDPYWEGGEAEQVLWAQLFVDEGFSDALLDMQLRNPAARELLDTITGLLLELQEHLGD